MVKLLIVLTGCLLLVSFANSQDVKDTEKQISAILTKILQDLPPKDDLKVWF